MTADMTPEQIYEELVRNGIVKKAYFRVLPGPFSSTQVPKVTMMDWVGEYK